MSVIAWTRRVNRVFNTLPRDANSAGTIWLSRQRVEEKFSALLEFSGVHVCIDGPSGTGKSSLAITGLHKADLRYVLVQITKNMKWIDFCRRLIEQPKNVDRSVSAELSAGLQRGLPTGTLRVSIGNKIRSLDNLELREKTIANWSEHDICNLMVEEQTSLLVDDFERADTELLIRISDMCKLLTETYASDKAKLIIVGTDNIYHRLFVANKSLEGRLEQVSLGTFPDQNDSWKFLQMGFEALKLRHPANDKRYVTKEQNMECIVAVYEAVDGLPKSLNELGRTIARAGYNRTRISPADVIDVAASIPIRNLQTFKRMIPHLHKLIENDVAVRIVLRQIYQNGVGQIHDVDDLYSQLESELQAVHIDSAIQQLVEHDFSVQTGKVGEVLFVAQPTFAHTFGVVISNPRKYNLDESKYGKIGQLSLPFSNFNLH